MRILRIYFFCVLLSGLQNFSYAQIITDTIYFDTHGIDARTYAGSTGTNYGTDTLVKVYYDYGPPNYSNASFFQIDLSSIPHNAIVMGASINLYAKTADNGADHSMYIDRVTSTWTETGITWSAMPSATSVGRISVPNSETTNTGWQSYDLKTQAQYSISNPGSNYGWRIILQSATGTVDKGVIYASSENAITAHRPYVIVEWQIPLTDTIYLDTEGIDAKVYSGSTTTNFGTDDSLGVNWDYPTAGFANRTFVQPDLSNIPQEALIVSADLYMYALSVENDTTHPYFVHAVTQSWTETGITWANQPSLTSAYSTSFPHTTTDSAGWHAFSIKNLTQAAVQVPDKYFGWRVALQSESGPNDKGPVYVSSEHDSVDWRPYMIIEYELPIEIEGYATHCTSGNNDGTITVSVTGGCHSYISYRWYRVSGGGLSTVEMGSNIADAGVSGLEDGLYLIEVTDYRSVSGYRFFFVGEEGATTNVSFGLTPGVNSQKYTEDAWVVYNKSIPDSNSTGGATTTIGCFTNSVYDARSFVQYQVDWDPSLEFVSARQAFRNKGGCIQWTNSDNDAWISRATNFWEEDYITWTNRPGVSTENAVYIPTTTTNGNEARNDTFDIAPLIPYWQEHPDENFGFELALNSYNQAAGASRDYSSGDYIGHNLMVSFTVKPKKVNAEISIIDSTDFIQVSTLDGYPPYTYLWSNGETSEDLSNVEAGIYWLKIWDSRNNLTKYEISKHNFIVWDSLICTDDSLTYVQFLNSCSLDSTGFAFADKIGGQVIEKTGNGWVEVQILPEMEERAIGLAVLNNSVRGFTDLSFGFYLDSEGSLFVIKNNTIQSTPVPYQKNDLLKIEKTGKVISYQVNGVEVEFFDFQKMPVPDYIPVAILTDQAYFREVRFGTKAEDFEDEPCTVTFEGIELNEFGYPVFTFCENVENAFGLPTGYYYRWFPEVGLSCFDCSNPTVLDATIAENTYALNIYESYGDYLAGIMCQTAKVTFVESLNCGLECSPEVQIIPDLLSYCEGDVIQFNVLLNDAVYVEFLPGTNFNCDGCLDPQYVIPSSGETLNFNFYNVPLGTEGAEVCENISFEINVNAACHEITGVSFNNYGAVVWSEKTGTNNIFINVHCNLLNEKVMFDPTSDPQIINGLFINEGTIMVRNHWTNNAENAVFNDAAIVVSGFGTEFEEGIVDLFGGYQMVKGVSSTGYHHLTLTGSDKKELFINTHAIQTLNLNHIELATRSYIMSVLNDEVTAITNTGLGFVSSNLEGGYLQWYMALEETYLYPLGSSIGGFRYKPLELTPKVDMYGKVRLVNYNPVYNGLIEKALDVEVVNPNYFYYIVPEFTDQVEKIAFHYHTILDGDYQHVAHWDNVWAPTQLPLEEPWWEKTTEISLDAPVPAYAINNTVVTTTNWTGFDGKEFALSMAGFVIDWDNFGVTGDEGDDEDGIVVEVVSVGGTSSGGDLGTLFGAGGGGTTGTTGNDNIFTPTPVEGTYQMYVTQDCGTNGIIQFSVNNSGNIVANSVYYVLSGSQHPLSEDLYNLAITTGSSGTGLFELFSIPVLNYVCDNLVQINLTSGIILEENGVINIDIPAGSGISITSIEVKDNDGVTVTPASTTSTSWTAPTMNEGIYRIELVLDDNGTPITLNGVFILKNI